MNVYTCWYHGTFGYGCRIRGRNWLFVPELGQSGTRVCKNLYLDELVFKNPFDKKFELDLEKRLCKFSLARIIKRLFLSGRKAHTVGGLLFTSV